MPLVRPQTGLILPPTNKLAYPAGRAPGFDSAHPASQKLAFSITPSGSAGTSVVNLTSGVPVGLTGGTIVPTPVLDVAIGPAWFNPSNATKGMRVNGLVATPTAGTFAVIFRPIGLPPSAYGPLVMSNADGSLFFAHNNAGALTPDIYTAGDNHASFTLTLGIPYFLVYSGSLVSGGAGYFVARNFNTGQIFQSTISVGSTYAGTAAATLDVGGSGSDCSNANIAAAMYSPNSVLALSQLLAWADDPWAFWYPRQTQMLVSADAAAVATQYAAFSIPQRGGRVITQMRGY